MHGTSAVMTVQNPPFEVIPGPANAPLFVFCDHASNYIPAQFAGLGLDGDDLSRHIAWDIGAADVTRGLCALLKGRGLLCGFSRLLIDANRPQNSSGLIETMSDGTVIEGNQSLSAHKRTERIEKYYNPYHDALTAQIEHIQSAAPDPLILSIHSFTRQPKTGTIRDVDIGLLWKANFEISHAAAAAIRSVYSQYRVGLNVPYSALTLNHSIDKHVIDRGLRHLTIEVCQDLIDTARKAAVVTGHIERALRPFLNAGD